MRFIRAAALRWPGLILTPTWRLMNVVAMFRELRREAYEANISLPRSGLVNLMFGNASAIDRSKGVFAIKPSGVGYDSLKVDDMVLLDLDGRIVEGKLRPSSDAPTHRRLFLAFPSAHGVVHTHSTHATAFAQAGRSIPILGTTHADYFRGDVPVTRKLRPAEIEHDYEWQTGNVIVEHFIAQDLSPAEIAAVLVNRHGPFTWGVSAKDAAETAVALECAAQMAHLTLQLGEKVERLETELRNKHFDRKHGPSAYYGQTVGHA